MVNNCLGLPWPSSIPSHATNLPWGQSRQIVGQPSEVGAFWHLEPSDTCPSWYGLLQVAAWPLLRAFPLLTPVMELMLLRSCSFILLFPTYPWWSSFSYNTWDVLFFSHVQFECRLLVLKLFLPRILKAFSCWILVSMLLLSSRCHSHFWSYFMTWFSSLWKLLSLVF